MSEKTSKSLPYSLTFFTNYLTTPVAVLYCHKPVVPGFSAHRSNQNESGPVWNRSGVHTSQSDGGSIAKIVGSPAIAEFIAPQVHFT